MYYTMLWKKFPGILTDAIETHFRAIRSLPFGVEYLIQLNPDFLLLVVRELLLYAPTQVSFSLMSSSMTFYLSFKHYILFSPAGGKKPVNSSCTWKESSGLGTSDQSLSWNARWSLSSCTCPISSWRNLWGILHSPGDFGGHWFVNSTIIQCFKCSPFWGESYDLWMQL